MVVIVLTACPAGLRGDLTRWLLEISAGVFVGHVSAKVRDRLWSRIVDLIRDGRAIMVYSARNEQHFAFRVHRADWTPEDCDGLELIKRPKTGARSDASARRNGWSNASKWRAARKFG
ncbi:type I-E CRISPR-associated endoribonuclease Cas2 [Bifidobacterium sp. CP2]|uniref:type I-E CRISPR-associated endoribonuclease Cas2e n=1 Tax=Bifidobacterium TaxID=1678 RepID=UPI001BDDC5C6|nr:MULTISPECIES: type I-E CRISPR-associated endoribonuclease Cas2e [Bifidobacterium]MBT1182138.1 type I-E CRISPR-associated endoribonuclease Cas2 [Bifidobacterium sp. CP2]MBW3081505.1 type I-E CRISPR-associated endoribonuclease Cas2 [Bifidobacterium saguinibicoloris]